MEQHLNYYLNMSQKTTLCMDITQEITHTLFHYSVKLEDKTRQYYTTQLRAGIN